MSLFLLFRLKHVYNGPFTLVQERTYKQQGSIPVGCGPPAFVVTVRGGGLWSWGWGGGVWSRGIWPMVWEGAVRSQGVWWGGTTPSCGQNDRHL